MGMSAAPTRADLLVHQLLHSLLSNGCQASHSCSLPTLSISPSTISTPLAYIYLHIQSLFSSALPLQGEDIIPSLLHPPEKMDAGSP